MKSFKIIVEKHDDGYTAYPLGVKGVVIGQGDTFDEALESVRSALAFHLETFGAEALTDDSDDDLDFELLEQRKTEESVSWAEVKAGLQANGKF